jgi:nucleoside-diphosphate-sugar epimerase
MKNFVDSNTFGSKGSSVFRSSVIGGGQLAKTFDAFQASNVLLFASGVSNSKCTDPKEFLREGYLLKRTLLENPDKKLIYFSSCALSAPEYPKNAYYQHKANMEALIKDLTDDYYIFRLPQLFGDLFLHKTLINFLYKCIVHNHTFKVFDNAYRYVIEINDVRTLVEAYVNSQDACVTIDLANPFRYKVLDIVKTFEVLLGKKANYEIVEKDDQYRLDLTPMLNFVQSQGLRLDFGSDYLHKKLSEKL